MGQKTSLHLVVPSINPHLLAVQKNIAKLVSYKIFFSWKVHAYRESLYKFYYNYLKKIIQETTGKNVLYLYFTCENNIG